MELNVERERKNRKAAEEERGKSGGCDFDNYQEKRLK
jgi:hypothetical protein